MPRKVMTAQPDRDWADGMSVQVEVSLPERQRARKVPHQARQSPVAPRPTPPRIPRITRLMALAIKFQDMVDRGEVRDYADFARLGYITRARVSQIMNLTLLAPDIQAEILFEPFWSLREKHLRDIASEVNWSEQRGRYSRWRENADAVSSPASVSENRSE